MHLLGATVFLEADDGHLAEHALVVTRTVGVWLHAIDDQDGVGFERVRPWHDDYPMA